MLLSCSLNTPAICKNLTFSGDETSAMIELINRSQQRIVAERVLLRTTSGENRLYVFSADLRFGEVKRVVGTLANYNHYDFKSGNVCEVDHLQFIDGSTWEAPSPM